MGTNIYLSDTERVIENDTLERCVQLVTEAKKAVSSHVKEALLDAVLRDLSCVIHSKAN